MLHGQVQPMPSIFTAGGYWMALYQTDSGGTTLTYSMWPTTPNTLKGFNSTGGPTAYTYTQVAALLASFFDASGMAAGAAATAIAASDPLGAAAAAQTAAISAASANTTSAINALIGSAPSTLSTLAAIDAYLAANQTAATALAATVGGKFNQPTGTTLQYVRGDGSVSTFATDALAAVTWTTISGKPSFATVATTGSYSSLTGLPTIPAAQVSADWNAGSGVAQILNKPTLGTASAHSASDFDAAGTAVAAVAALNIAAPQTVAALAAINAELASDESAAAALTTVVGTKVSLSDPRLAINAFAANLGTTARRSGKIFLSGLSGLSSHTSAVVWQSAVPGSGKGIRTDNAELEQIRAEAVIVNDTSLRIHWMANGPVLGNFNFFYQFKN